MTLTGYRTDELAEQALTFFRTLTALPLNDEGNIDIDLLDVDYDPESPHTQPSAMFRRAVLELATTEFLHESYPEWLGDSHDDACAAIDVIAEFNSVREYGWGDINDAFNSILHENPDLKSNTDFIEGPSSIANTLNELAKNSRKA